MLPLLRYAPISFLTALGLLLLPGCRVSEGAESAPSATSAVQRADSASFEPVYSDSGTVAIAPVMRRILVRRDTLWERALQLHYDAIVIDGHVDTPTLMLEEGYQLGDRHPAHWSEVDLPRMFEGGLDAAFFALYVPPPLGEGPAALQRVERMIDELEHQVASLSDSAAFARSAADVFHITRSGRKAILMGLEGGHAIGASESVLESLYQRGVRYVTVTHINSNSWADASQGHVRWNGLNDRGRELIRAMNRLGMIVDLSHTSDSTFYDALAASRAPVLLSHSSARALTPGVRNASDHMLRALAENGGVVMINFFDAMVNPSIDDDLMQEVHRRLEGSSLAYLWNTVYEVKRERGLPGAALSHVVDHIDHAVRVAGIDHVGIGSDFDGVFDLPAGLEDVTRLPWITYELLARGYSDDDVRKILGGNVLRVMREVEAVAEEATAR